MTRLASLKVTTPSDREIVLYREFNARRRLVFEAMTAPELLKRWLLGPPGWTMIVCEVDLKVDGRYRYVWRNDDGSEMGMHGDYRQIVPPERIVSTEVFDFGCVQSGESQVTAVLTEHEGRTTLTTTVFYASKEARDKVIASGMEHGVAASYDRLEAIVTSTSASPVMK